MISKGMIGFSNNKTSFMGKLIRLFTNSGITHTFIITFPRNGAVWLEEASTVVAEGSFQSSYVDEPNTAYWVYKIKDGLVPEATTDTALQYCHDNFLGVKYGFFQLIWFPYRWVMENIFRKDVRHDKNWMTDGVICSELVYNYLYQLGDPFKSLLSDFNSDTIQAQDILDIVKAHPELFELVDQKL
jgi:hypothetical protein